MTLSPNQKGILTALLRDMTSGHVSTLVASLGEPNSQIGTSTDSKNYAFLQKMSEWGLAEEVALEVDLPPEIRDVLTSFVVNGDGKAVIGELLQAPFLNEEREP